MPTVNAVAAVAPDQPLVRTTVERRDPGPLDVVIDIAYCGICHTDIDAVRGEFGRPSYPLTPGHEIVGLVSAVGAEVTRHAVGDRVGVGFVIGSCGECEACLAGEEQSCERRPLLTHGSRDRDGTITQGGYSTSIVVTEEFVLRVPESLDLAAAAPLLCAGITTYSPLRRWGVGPGTRLAVVGMGGLGHLGVKIAHALGAEVSVLSHSLAKRDDGLRFGADHYHATGDPATLKSLRGSFDLVLNTVSTELDLDAYLSTLRRGGTLVEVGLPARPLSVSPLVLCGARRSLAGSNLGGIRETQEMLDFCAEHDIAAEVEVIDAGRIDEAYARVLASDVRYRFAIDIATLR